MPDLHFTVHDLLASSEGDPEDLFAAQLLQSYRTLLAEHRHDEQPLLRQFSREDYRSICSFLSAQKGNPLGFALFAALRNSAQEGIPFVTSLLSERVIVGTFDEHEGVFRGPTGNPLEDPDLYVSYHDDHATRYWLFVIPSDYPQMLVLEATEDTAPCYHVMYRPRGREALLPGVFLPYDALYPQSTPRRLETANYVVQKQRIEQPGNYALMLGTFTQFALEAFPILCPGYRIPTWDQWTVEHPLELYLRARYGQRFQVHRTSFQAEGDHGFIRRRLPDWAQRWMILWRGLPAGTPIGKEEILALLDLLWNVPMDAQRLRAIVPDYS